MLEKDEPQPLPVTKSSWDDLNYFLPPLELYLKTHATQTMENDLDEELACIVRFASARVLAGIARKYTIDTEGLSRKEVREKLLANLKPLDILLELF